MSILHKNCLNRTYSAKPKEINKQWWLIDAKDMILGRLAAEVSMILRGKHKPTYTPHMDCGDNVIIINAKKIKLLGKKADPNIGKVYYRHTGYPGGLKTTTAGKILKGNYPGRVIETAIKGMINRNKLGRQQMRNLYIYADENHIHQAQQPKIYDLAAKIQKNPSKINQIPQD